VVTEFIRRGERVAIPAVLGSAELNRRLQLVGAHDAIEFGNIRVAGPVPYEGDDVTLLLALFRARTTDWLARSLKLVEDVAGAVGFAGLAAAAPLARSLVRGLESFLDVPELELRVGAYRSWSSPSGPDGAAASATELAPMHLLIVRRSGVDADPAELAALRVHDGKLVRLVGADLVPYREHDFILVGVHARRRRDDYRQLPFFTLWEQTKRQLVDGELAAARGSWRRTTGAILTEELTRPQQQALIAEYEEHYAELVQRYADPGYRQVADGYGRPPVAALPELPDDDPEAVLRRRLG